MKPVAIPRTLKELSVMKMDKSFDIAWKKYTDENKELSYKKNRSYMMVIKTLAKYNYTQSGELNIYIAHNAAVDIFTKD